MMSEREMYPRTWTTQKTTNRSTPCPATETGMYIDSGNPYGAPLQSKILSPGFQAPMPPMYHGPGGAHYSATSGFASDWQVLPVSPPMAMVRPVDVPTQCPPYYAQEQQQLHHRQQHFQPYPLVQQQQQQQQLQQQQQQRQQSLHVTAYSAPLAMGYAETSMVTSNAMNDPFGRTGMSTPATTNISTCSTSTGSPTMSTSTIAEEDAQLASLFSDTTSNTGMDADADADAGADAFLSAEELKKKRRRRQIASSVQRHRERQRSELTTLQQEEKALNKQLVTMRSARADDPVGQLRETALMERHKRKQAEMTNATLKQELAQCTAYLSGLDKIMDHKPTPPIVQAVENAIASSPEMNRAVSELE